MALYEETKQLQEENNAKFSGTGVPDKTFVQAFRERADLFKGINYQNAQPLDISLTPSDTPKSWGRRLGPFYDPGVQQENFLAEQQSGWERMGYMIPRIATKAASEIIQLPGYLGGAVAWGLTGFDKENVNMMVDNFWQRAVRGVEEDVKDRLPVYTADVVKNGNLLKNIFSTSFWANDGADGIGFLMGFLAPGAALRYAGFGAKMAKLIKPGTAIAKAGRAGQATEELTAAGMKLAGNVDDITSTLVNTLFESAAEGGETYRNILAETGDKQRAAEGAVDVVQKNFGILGISNYIDQKWLFGKYGLIKDYARATKGLAKGSEYNRIFSTAVGEEGKILDAVAKRTTWNQIGKLSKTVAEGFLKEGFWEEGAQFAVSKHAEEDTEDNEGFIGELTDIAKTYADNLFETDMQKSIFLGGVLGSTMAGISTIREMKGTDKMLGNFHSLIKENNLDRYTSMSDLYEIDPNTNKPKIVNGKYQIDTNKAKEQLQRQFAKYIQSKQLVQLAKDGNIEAFEKLKDQRDLDYFLPFLQQQGGLEAAIYHINNLAETDMKWMKDEGVPIDVEQTKQELINKVVKFQKIYDKISDTHDLNINVKYKKEDQATYDNFSNLVKSIKLGTEAGLKFSLDRIDAIRGQLSNYKISDNNTVSISSSEPNTSPKLVEDLKTGLKENKANLSESDIISIENAIKNIEGHITLVDKSRKRLGELYDNKVLQKEFESFKSALTKEEETATQVASDVTKAKKSKAAGLNPALAKLYNDTVLYESFEGNDIRHSGQVAIQYRDDAGQLNVLTAEVIEPNSSGNLTIKGVKNEGFNKEGQLVELADSGTHFLNADGTLNYSGKTYKIEDEPVIVKTPKEVAEERRASAIITSIEEMITGYKNGIESIEDRISKGIDYRNELQDRLNKLLDKEQKSQEESGTVLTKKGTERVQSVKQKRSRGKNIEQVFLTSKQLMDEIDNADELITGLTITRDLMKNNVESLKATLSDINLSKDIMSSLNKTLDSLTEMSLSYDDLITGTQESLEGSKEYLRKLNNVLKGFHTSAARILGIEDQVNEIRSRTDLNLDQKNNTISDLIAVTFVNNTYSPEVYEEIATIQETIDKIQGNATQLQQNILELQKITTNNIRIKEGLNRLILLNRTVLSRFNKNYIELAKKLGVLKSKKVPKESRVSTPEDKLADPKFRENNTSFIVKWEANKKHQFNPNLGDNGVDNWFISTGNQKQAQSNNDVARWYNFVNFHAGKKDEGRHIYIFKTFTFDQIGKLEPNHFIRQNLKFTVNEEGDQMTYDQIKDKNNAIAKNDIKIVAYERTGKLLLVGQNGEIGVNDASNMITSSLPLPNLKTKSGYDRFGVNKEKARFYQKLGVTEDTATPLQKDEFNKYITKALENSKLEYEKIRAELLSGGQITFEINSINPGNKVTKNANDKNILVEQDVLTATGLKSTKSLYKKIHIEARKEGNDAYNTIVDRTYSGTEHGIVNGFWYLRYNNRLELIKPKTFGETESVDTIVALFQHVAKGLDSKDNAVRNYLQTIIYSGINDTTGKESPYKFYLDYEKGVKDFTGIVFGNNRISREDLVEGKNLDSFKAFLNTKFWNFNNKLLDQNEFVEYVIVNGKVTPKTWEFEDGGYKGFLFSNNPEHNNKTKGTVYIKPRAGDGLELAKDPQYENQSISLIRTDKKATESTTNNPAKSVIGKGTTQKSTEDEPIVGNKPFVPFGQKASIKEDTSGEKPFIPFGQKTPITKTEDTSTNEKPFIPFGSKPAKPVEANGLGDQTPSKPKATTTEAPTSAKELTSDEYWASVKEDRQAKYLKATDGDLDKAKQNAYATYKRVLRENNNLNREAIIYDEYERENLDAAKAWLKEKFPNIPVEIVNGLIDGKDWGRLTKQATVLLSSIAASGTAYHEGFHLFSQLVLSDKVRSELYDEVRKRLPNQKAINPKTGEVAEFDNKNLTDKEVEEILAEEFRMYMISPESYTFDKYAKAQKSFFRKLWDLILQFFNINKEDYNIERVFNIIRNREFDVYAKELPDTYGRVMDRTRVRGLSDKETLVFTRDMNYRFFDTLFDPETTYSDTHLLDVNTERFTEDIYDDMLNQYNDLADINGPDSYYAKIVSHYEDMKKEHKRFLKQYNIDTRNVMENIREEEEDEDSELDNSSYTYRDPITIDLVELIDNPVRMLIAGLPTVVKDSKLLADLTEYKTRSTVRFNRIMRLLNENLADLGVDFNTYADKLVRLSEKYPDLKVLIERLKIGTDNISQSTLILRNQFVRVFAHHLSTPLMTNYKPNGVKNTFDARDQDRSRLIRTKWQNNAMASVGYKSSMVGVNKRGAYIVNTTKLQQAIQYANTFPEGSRNRLNAYLGALRGIGITITQDHNEVYNYKVVDNYVKRLSQEITARKGTELLVSDLFNANVVENQVETKALVTLAKTYFINDTDLSFYNQDGNREYPINLHSHTTDTIDLLNRITYDPETDQLIYPEDAEYLMAWNGSKGNLFNGSSYWRDHQKTGGKIKVVDLKGIVDQFNNKNSSRISNTTFGDYKAITFNALLHGIYIQLRSADRRRELGFMLTNEDGTPAKINHNIDQQTFKNRMMGYLKDELITSFALLIESQNGTNAWGNDLTHYRKNARELRTFKFLYDKDLNKDDKVNIVSLERFVEDRSIVDNNDTVSISRFLADKYIDKYSDYIDRSFTRYIDKMASLTEKSLREDSVIQEKFTSTGESMGIRVKGIDTEILSKMNIPVNPLYGILTRNQLNKMILFANYTSFIGNQEQLKYIMGDTAMWKDTTDFHKRVNGATSPKNKLADSKELRDQMNELYARVDGKERTDGVDIVVVEDIISSNETLGKIYSEYNETNGTDAESYATLDEYRDIMIRNGLWYNNHEKTYQWEMQNFVLRLLDIKKSKKSKHPFLKKISSSMFTDPNGIFYKHTKGTLPESPMFNGKYLSETELGVLTIQKPQGFGHIKESIGLNTPQFFKTSTAPLFPSSIETDSKMLDVILSMMEAGQGILAFSSSMKGEVINSQNLFDIAGSVPKEGYGSQQLKYADFGLQLDISEDEKGEVTVSTQRTRLEFIDIFNSGEIVGNPELLSLKEEYDRLTNDIVATERKTLLNSLGLTLNDATGRYELKDGESITKFKEKLISSFNFALLPYNIIDGMDLSLDSSEKVFDMAVNKRKIEEVLTSLIKKNVIGRKTKGDMLVQESSVLYDQDLKFYREEGGKILPMEVVISLPLDLIPVMKRVGGLKNLNDAIRRNDTDLLGEDFFKILDIPMNRIPGQALSSLDIGRVKYFLPYYHGSKVILPPEITTKTGSDFDVDKMTAYFHYYKVEDGQLKYHNYPESNLEVMKNHLNDIAIKATLHPSRFNELIKPLTSKNIKNLTNEYNKKIIKSDVEQEAYDTLGKNNNKWDNIVSWWYNMQKGYEFFSAKKGTAIAAVHNAANAFSQQHPVRMKAIVPLFFKGHELTSDEYYNTGFVYDSDDYTTSRNFGEFLSAFVDVVKDPFIFDLTDSNTFNTIALLNRYGKNAGIGLESIVSFMTQPAIREYLKVRRENSPKFLSYNDRINFKDQYEETVKRLKAKTTPIEFDSSIPTTYEATVASHLNNLFNTPNDEKDLAKELLTNKLESVKYKPFSKKELKSKEIRTDFKAQVQILDNFMTYQILAQKLVSLNLILRPDARSSMGRHLLGIDADLTIPQKTLLDTGLFNEDDFEKAIGGVESSTGKGSYPKTLITEFFRTQLNTSGYFGDFFLIQKDPTISNFFAENVIPYLADPNKWKKRVDIDRALIDVESDLISFIIADSLDKKSFKEMVKFYQDIFVNENSVPKELLALKNVIEGNVAINELEPKISERIRRTRAIAEADSISLFNKNFNVQEMDAIESDLYTLGVEPNDRNRRFVYNLMMHSVFQSGFNTSANSYMGIIPNRLFIDVAEKAISNFKNMTPATKELKLRSFLDQFFRNNAANTKVVPRHPWPMRGGKKVKYWFTKTYEDKKNFYKDYNYIAFNYYTHDPKSYFKVGTNPPMDIVLYRRMPGSDNMFEVISKQGEGSRMKEYYPMLPLGELDNATIIESNRYNQRPLDVSYAEEENTFDPDLSTTDEDLEEEGLYFDASKLNGEDFKYLPDGMKNTYFKSLGKNSPMHQALRMIEEKSTNEGHIKLARVLRSAVKTAIPLHISKEFFNVDENTQIPEVVGFYDTIGREAYVYENLDDYGFEVATLHEAMHALTHDEIKKNSEFKKRIQRIADHAYYSILKSGKNRDIIQSGYDLFTDPDEFVAHAFTNGKFQNVLAQIEAENPELVANKSKKISVFADFMNELMSLIRKYFDAIFGITYEEYNYDMQVLDSALQDLIVTVEETMFQEFTPEPANKIIHEINPVIPTEEIKVINKNEKSKEPSNSKFEETYPEYAYLNTMEKEAFQTLVDQGKIQLACGI